MVTEIIAIIVAVVAICIASYLSFTTQSVLQDTKKVLQDVKVLLIGSQVHSMALGRSIDQLAMYTMRAGPPTIKPLPFTSYD